MGSALADMLDRRRDVLIARWLDGVRRHYAPRPLPEAILRNHLPDFLDALSTSLREGQAELSRHADSDSEVSKTGAQHGQQRFEAGFDVSALVREYGELREVMFDLMREEHLIPHLDQIDILVQCISTGVAEAIARYSQAREGDLQAAKAELEQAAEFRERFLGVVSHDLRGPLQAIGLSARSIMADGQLSLRVTRAAERIIDSARRLDRLVYDLLDFTRGRLGGGIPIRRELANLAGLVDAAVKEAEATHADVKIVAETGAPLTGMWDPARISQMVGNLLSNAIQHGKPQAPVTVRMRERQDDVVLEFHNLGEPIEREMLPHIFAPFRRGEAGRSDSARSAGLGLGLYIVQQIVLAHEGKITVSSSVENGTTFQVALPRAAMS